MNRWTRSDNDTDTTISHIVWKCVHCAHTLFQMRLRKPLMSEVTCIIIVVYSWTKLNYKEKKKSISRYVYYVSESWISVSFKLIFFTFPKWYFCVFILRFNLISSSCKQSIFMFTTYFDVRSILFPLFYSILKEFSCFSCK